MTLNIHFHIKFRDINSHSVVINLDGNLYSAHDAKCVKGVVRGAVEYKAKISSFQIFFHCHHHRRLLTFTCLQGGKRSVRRAWRHGSHFVAVISKVINHIPFHDKLFNPPANKILLPIQIVRIHSRRLASGVSDE